VKEIKAYIRPHELKTVAVMGDNLSKLLFAFCGRAAGSVYCGHAQTSDMAQ